MCVCVCDCVCVCGSHCMCSSASSQIFLFQVKHDKTHADLGCWNWWVLRIGSSLAGRDRRSAKQELDGDAFGCRDRDLSEKFGGVASQT